MSCHGWESGTLTVPADDLAAVKTAVVGHARTFHADVRAAVLTWHVRVGGGTRSAAVYRDALTRVSRTVTDAPPDDGYPATVTAAALSVLTRVVSRAEGRCGGDIGDGGDIEEPTVADQAWSAPAVTDHESTFTVFTAAGLVEASLVFGASTVTWEVWDANTSIDAARHAPMGQVFFDALDGVRWSPGTGGVIVFDDVDHHQGPGGGGANIVTAQFGPDAQNGAGAAA